MNEANLYIETEIINAILTSGIAAHLDGFKYLQKGIYLTLTQPEILRHLTKGLYPEIAKGFNSNGEVVERGIRNCIENAYKSKTLFGINELLNSTYYHGDDKPRNGTFIAILTSVVKRNICYKIVSAEQASDKPSRFLQDLRYIMRDGLNI